jgi:hypothetical protein
MDGHYQELLEPDDDDQAPDVAGDLAALSWQAGYGAALVDAENDASGENWGNRILDAADRMAGKDIFWDGES